MPNKISFLTPSPSPLPLLGGEGKGEGGFSLVEILVVIALISVVLGVIIVRSQGVSDQSKINTAKGDLRVIEKAIHTYYLHHTNYPSGTDWQSADLLNESPRILPSILKDPFAPASQYVYLQSPDAVYYAVISRGLNGVQNINGIDNNGMFSGANADDLFITNGTGTQGSGRRRRDDN